MQSNKLTASAAPAKHNFVSLQALRGLAAVAVAFYHVYIILLEPEYGAQSVFQPIARHGFLGVSFFFVLSGFIIFMAHKNDIGNPGSILTYSYKRIIRVYPAYWIYTTLFIVAAAVGLGYPDFSWSPLNLISSYLLIPFVSDMTLPLKVAWTLVYEMRFYAIFILLLAFGWKMLWAIWAWAIAIIAVFVLGIETVDVLSPWNLYFIAGVAGYLLLDKLDGKRGIYLFLAGIILAVIYGFLSHDIERIAHLNRNRQELHFILVPTFLALIIGVVAIEKNYALVLPKWLTFLGDASYSIYLTHSAAISALLIIFKALGLNDLLGVKLTFLVVFLLSVLAGSIAYLLFEKPMVDLLRKPLRKKKSGLQRS